MTTNASELRNFDEDELAVKLTEARRELFNLRFQSATGRLDNSARIGQVKHEIARVLTVQRAREIELAESLVPTGQPGRRMAKES